MSRALKLRIAGHASAILSDLIKKTYVRVNWTKMPSEKGCSYIDYIDGKISSPMIIVRERLLRPNRASTPIYICLLTAPLFFIFLNQLGNKTQKSHL